MEDYKNEKRSIKDLKNYFHKAFNLLINPLKTK